MATQAQTKNPGTREGWQFECKKETGIAEDCGFLLRNHDLPQLVRLAQVHIKDTHNANVPDAYVRSTAKEVRY